jgi:hypothetical protein
MTVQASDASMERVFSKGFAETSWNGTRSQEYELAGKAEALRK